MSKCAKFDTCFKIKIIQDKDMLDFQYVQSVKDVCGKCEDKPLLEPPEGLKEKIKSILRNACPEYEEAIKFTNASSDGDWTRLDAIDEKVATHILSLIPRQVEEIKAWGDTFCVDTSHYGSDKRANTRKRECRKCWQSLPAALITPLLKNPAEEIITGLEKVLEDAPWSRRIGAVEEYIQTLKDKHLKEEK